MGSPLGPLLANVLCHPSKIPLSDKENFHPFTIDMLMTATTFLHTLNSVHTSFKFTMEVEKNGKLPFLGTELLNHAPLIETKVYVKPTNTGLLLHYQSHVDNRYKQSILTAMLDRAHQLPSS